MVVSGACWCSSQVSTEGSFRDIFRTSIIVSNHVSRETYLIRLFFIGIMKASFPTYNPRIDNPTPHKIPEGDNAAPLEVIGACAQDKLIIIMVGLPGTGKTHIANRIARFISFFHDIPTKIFNVGDYRRRLIGTHLSAKFFDHSNEKNVAIRTSACNSALDDLIEFMTLDGVRLGIYDATDVSRSRRKEILDILDSAQVYCKKMFLETICDDESVLKQHVMMVQASAPDYENMDSEKVVEDYMERRSYYMNIYEPLDDGDGSFVKVFNNKKFVIHNIRGYLPLKVVHFIMHLHTLPRTFYFTRHGQSEYNELGKIGGDSGLSVNGEEYARRLAKYALDVIGKEKVINDHGEEVEVMRPARLWTSTLRRTKETAKFIKHDEFEAKWDNGDEGKWVQFRPMQRRNLDEIYAGSCDGMTYKEIEYRYPEEFARRQDDKLAYRYPRGESYMDVILRLEPMAQEMERVREPILIIGHQGILRILYAYFMGMKREDAPHIDIPLNHIIKLSPHAYGCAEETICLMHKEEMLLDGQTEPITSMPKKEGEISANYDADDPIMFAPSH